MLNHQIKIKRLFESDCVHIKGIMIGMKKNYRKKLKKIIWLMILFAIVI